jgi:hypothetical protein
VWPPSFTRMCAVSARTGLARATGPPTFSITFHSRESFVPSPAANLLDDLCTALGALGLRWYVFGAQAVVIHGRPPKRAARVDRGSRARSKAHLTAGTSHAPIHGLWQLRLVAETGLESPTGVRSSPARAWPRARRCCSLHGGSGPWPTRRLTQGISDELAEVARAGIAAGPRVPQQRDLPKVANGRRARLEHAEGCQLFFLT